MCLDCLDVLILKINFYKKYNIILMYFLIKKIFKNSSQPNIKY